MACMSGGVDVVGVWKGLCLFGFLLYMVKIFTGCCLIVAVKSRSEKMLGCSQLIQVIWLCAWMLLAILIPASRFSTNGRICGGDYTAAYDALNELSEALNQWAEQAAEMSSDYQNEFNDLAGLNDSMGSAEDLRTMGNFMKGMGIFFLILLPYIICCCCCICMMVCALLGLATSMKK